MTTEASAASGARGINFFSLLYTIAESLFLQPSFTLTGYCFFGDIKAYLTDSDFSGVGSRLRRSLALHGVHCLSACRWHHRMWTKSLQYDSTINTTSATVLRFVASPSISALEAFVTISSNLNRSPRRRRCSTMSIGSSQTDNRTTCGHSAAIRRRGPSKQACRSSST